MGKVRTILGDIAAEDVGLCMPHEHLLTRPTEAVLNTPNQILMMDSVPAAVEIAKAFAAAGGRTMGELTTASWGRNVPGMVKASQEAGIHVIATTGHICDGLGLPAEVKYMEVNDIADEMIRDITEGMDGTEHKAGMVKAGTSYMKVTANEEKVLRAAARAAIETGVPLHTHTSTGTMGLEQIEIAVDEEGLPPERMIIAHVDRNPDPWYHRKMLNKGIYLIYDGPGKAKYYPDNVRVELLRTFVEEGFAKQLMLSNDIGKRSYHAAYGGGPGHPWLLERFLPRLLEEGFSQDTLDIFMCHNPATVYTIV